MLTDIDIEGLERAVVESVGPEKVVEVDGWLVPLDDGAIGRAKSAVPLSHEADPGAIAAIEAAYAEAGLPPAFRVAETEGLASVREALRRGGYQPHTPTIMKFGAPEGLAALSERPAELMAAPDAAWVACFSGEGFDPMEAAARVRNLARSPEVRFAVVREGPRALAVGVVSFGGGWAGIHGMRTAPDHRRQGLASRVLAAIGAAAAERGVGRTVLQVKEDNPARSLYRAGGFAWGWRYQYWARP
jgi:GNAT superfamily N-acetyltransferase